MGTKILISGGGKCNITHEGPIEELLKAFRPNEARFIRPSCYRFTNLDVLTLFKDRGLEVYTRPDGRIFPVDKTAKDVVSVLRACLVEAGVTISLGVAVSGLLVEESVVVGVQMASKSISANAVIVSTGGSSYPASGTTGDAWPWAKKVGHSIVKIRAALAPIHLILDGDWAANSGVSLRDCILKARQHGKEIARWRGDLLFTHQGISGPTVLGISRCVAEHSGLGPITVEADILPDQSFEHLTQEIRSWALANPRRPWFSYVSGLMPERLALKLLESLQVSPNGIGTELDRKGKNRLVAELKGWQLGTVRDVPIEKGEVVAGGIMLDEVDPQSMRSTKCRGLFLCGEVLDIAGPVGGYNLQAAFSTGYVAGETAALDAIR